MQLIYIVLVIFMTSSKSYLNSGHAQDRDVGSVLNIDVYAAVPSQDFVSTYLLFSFVLHGAYTLIYIDIFLGFPPSGFC